MGHRVGALAAVAVLWAGGLAACDPPPPPVVLTVDSAADAVDASPGDGVCAATTGGCTFRAALAEASASRVDRIDLSPSIPTVVATNDAPYVLDPVAPTLTILGPAAADLPELAGPAHLEVRSGTVVLRRVRVSVSGPGAAVRVRAGGSIGFDASVVAGSDDHAVALDDGAGPLVVNDSVVADNLGSGLVIGRDVTAVVKGSVVADNGGEGLSVAEGAEVYLYEAMVTGNDVGIMNSGSTTGRFVTVARNATVGVAGAEPVSVSGSIVIGAVGSTGEAYACATPVASEGWNGLGVGCGTGPTIVTLPVDAVPFVGADADAYRLSPSAAPVVGLMSVGDGPCVPGAADERVADGSCDAGFRDGAVGTPWTFVVDTPLDLGDAEPGDGTCDTGDGTCSLRAVVEELRTEPVPSPVARLDVDVALDATLTEVPELTIDGLGHRIDIGPGPVTFCGPLRFEDTRITTRVTEPPDDFYIALTPGACGGGEAEVGLRRSSVTDIPGWPVVVSNGTHRARADVYQSSIVRSRESALVGSYHARVARSTFAGNNVGGKCICAPLAIGYGDTSVPNGSLVLVDSEVSGSRNGAIVAGADALVLRSRLLGGQFGFNASGPFSAVIQGSTVVADSAAVYAQEGLSLEVIDSTLVGGARALGVVVVRADATITASTVTAPRPLTLGEDAAAHVLASVIAGEQGCRFFGDPPGQLTSGGYNVAADPSCAFGEATDLVGVDPMLGPLADNGGRSPTMLPAAGSPVLDRIPLGTPGLCDGVGTDQRGVARPRGPACDTGAVER